MEVKKILIWEEKKGQKGSKKIRLFGRKKRNLNFTFQHTFIWEGKKKKKEKKNTSNTRSFGRGKKTRKRNF